ncbi:hypothetical protein AQJ46_43265 [Streptomyces canus]|uniref:Uncharacterized protein n=1 Tax=Streptomyces canus TaxID=58343 RepID=A0A101RMF5_9ACTN|nr:hypothetical protein AQJ46_43265 [Streptomyces canus]
MGQVNLTRTCIRPEDLPCVFVRLAQHGLDQSLLLPWQRSDYTLSSGLSMLWCGGALGEGGNQLGLVLIGQRLSPFSDICRYSGGEGAPLSVGCAASLEGDSLVIRQGTSCVK